MADAASRDSKVVDLAPALVVVVEESVQLRNHPSTGAHHDATNIVIVRGLVGDEDAVVRRNGTFRKLASLACAMCVESALGDEDVEVYVQLQGRAKALHECVFQSVRLRVLWNREGERPASPRARKQISTGHDEGRPLRRVRARQGPGVSESLSRPLRVNGEGGPVGPLLFQYAASHLRVARGASIEHRDSVDRVVAPPEQRHRRTAETIVGGARLGERHNAGRKIEDQTDLGCGLTSRRDIRMDVLRYTQQYSCRRPRSGRARGRT